MSYFVRIWYQLCQNLIFDINYGNLVSEVKILVWFYGCVMIDIWIAKCSSCYVNEFRIAQMNTRTLDPQKKYVSISITVFYYC
jgi:hypothetical protein